MPGISSVVSSIPSNIAKAASKAADKVEGFLGNISIVKKNDNHFQFYTGPQNESRMERAAEKVIAFLSIPKEKMDNWQETKRSDARDHAKWRAEFLAKGPKIPEPQIQSYTIPHNSRMSDISYAFKTFMGKYK